MSDLKYNWPSNAFDAVRVMALNGEFKIEGTDGDEVVLEGELNSRLAREFKPEPVSRWLLLNLWGHHGQTEFTLRLPKNKAWVVDVVGMRADMQVKDIQARLHIAVGKGDIKVERCRGQFAIAAGQGDVVFEHCTEAEMPERPPMPEGQAEMAGAPMRGIPPIPPIPPMPEGPEVMFGFRHGPRVRFRRGPGPDDESGWEDWDGEEWAQWGQQLGESAAAWAQGFVGQMFGKANWLNDRYGLSLQFGHSDIELKDVEFKTCAIHTGSGDLEIEGGRIETLSLESNHGDIEIDKVLPTGEWSIHLHHGDIELNLPSQTRARLDVATRHGDIDSEIPLVRVGRPGRESRHGSRMVGAVGPEGQGAQISVTTLSGDIQIRGPRGTGARYDRPAETYTTAPQPTAATPATPAAAAPAASPQSEDRPAAVATPQSEDRPAAATSAYDSQVAVLQALAEGKISVAEAEQLLHSLR